MVLKSCSLESYLAYFFIYIRQNCWKVHWRTGSLVKSCSIVFLVNRKKQCKEICKFLTIGLEHKPLPSSKNSLLQNEVRCTTFLVKMSFIFMRMKNEFHIKGWAPTLVLKQRPGGTRKWPIDMCSLSVCLRFSAGRGEYLERECESDRWFHRMYTTWKNGKS